MRGEPPSQLRLFFGGQLPLPTGFKQVIVKVVVHSTSPEGAFCSNPLTPQSFCYSAPTAASSVASAFEAKTLRVRVPTCAPLSPLPGGEGQGEGDFLFQSASCHAPVLKYGFNCSFNVSRARWISDFVADTEQPSTFAISSYETSSCRHNNSAVRCFSGSAFTAS